MPDLFEEIMEFGFIDDNTVRINLLDERSNYGVMYGLNWAFNPNTGMLRDVSRTGNESYIQLPQEVYTSDFFPKSEIFIITDDLGKDYIFNRSQPKIKDGDPQALSTPESNRIFGLYIRHRLGLKSGALITKNDLLNYGRTDIVFKKEGNSFYMDFSTDRNIGRNGRTINNQQLQQPDNDAYNSLLTALRTKPFVLLAGISGTGKSRIVRELAKASVTEKLQRKYDPKSVANGFNRWQLHKPANFELVQVKPNWHNSLEVVGYKSNIGGAHYEFTPFVEFVARAWQNQDVPFFLCLDEMNLAPVEQYFAEFLSAIESRSLENGEYETDPIVKPFAEFGNDVCTAMLNHLVGTVDAANVRADSPEAKLVERFRTKGLTLPPNLLVLGTVNMDETTFSFSRKVLDRAMSIVMNDVEYDAFFNGESENTVAEMDEGMRDWLIHRPIRGLDAENNGAEDVKTYLTSINTTLNNTPFKLGYRAANEALLYVSAARQLNPDADINAALDEFTLMKILSRIEGDKRSIDNLLDNLQSVITTVYPKSHEKLEQMAETLNSKQFVSYWT